VSTATIELVYHRLAPVYDVIYGAMLQPGRRRAMAHLAPRAGELILEVGVGTGFGLRHYPPGCRVVAIDLSSSMIARAHARLRRRPVPGVSLCRMDAAHLALPRGGFDAVYAPYLVNVVPEPIEVAREMIRVCRPGGRLVFLNHFDRLDGRRDAVDRLVGVAAERISGVNWHLDFESFMRESGLEAQAVERVNVPRVSAVVLCRRP
jgi:phosphatidylethanolamine/phosphatidyl-N-methylethanolamine N-methyltransferase